jgi:hypothetical protein
MKEANEIAEELYDRQVQHCGGGEKLTKWLFIKSVSNAINAARNEKAPYKLLCLRCEEQSAHTKSHLTSSADVIFEGSSLCMICYEYLIRKELGFSPRIDEKGDNIV